MILRLKGKGAARAAVFAGGLILLHLSLGAALLLMIVMNLGAHGPSFGEFLLTTWPLWISVGCSGLACLAAVHSSAGVAAIPLAAAVAALAGLWWMIFG